MNFKMVVYKSRLQKKSQKDLTKKTKDDNIFISHLRKIKKSKKRFDKTFQK